VRNAPPPPAGHGPAPEIGPQRRKSTDGHLLHCCCICLTLAPWSDEWSCFASYQEMDEGKPFPKFCSAKCRTKGGPDARCVTAEMARVAKDQEWREPRQTYRPPSYVDALDRQRRHAKSFSERGTPGPGGDAA
jgi:hypothetical protein